MQWLTSFEIRVAIEREYSRFMTHFSRHDTSERVTDFVELSPVNESRRIKNRRPSQRVMTPHLATYTVRESAEKLPSLGCGSPARSEETEERLPQAALRHRVADRAPARRFSVAHYACDKHEAISSQRQVTTVTHSGVTDTIRGTIVGLHAMRP